MVKSVKKPIKRSGSWGFGGRSSLCRECFRGLRRRDFFNFEAAAFVNCFLQTEAQKGLERRLHYVGGIFRTQRFAEDIFDARGFEDGANGFAGDDTRAR